MSEDKSVEEVQGADKAAAKIQAGFRGYRVRKRLQEEKKAKEKNQNDEASADSEEESHQDHMENSNKSNDGLLEDKSATKIQAGIRGYLVRKRQQAEQAAATRIQAGFRGFRTRKLLKQSGQ
ncbi:abnormal spindle-like microcephaly-associated protein homolog [Nasonia vitripennis]|uniref:Uncharacterized protein n=1 Tax=Nasonia vitripennis TaxID=7425 RepID=A0A7M7G4U1_NASVI|nr:uncharacterized protein LOC100120532 [Nasonia vitripennis]